MTSELKDLVDLLEAMLEGTEADRAIEAKIAQYERWSNASVLEACHEARHFMADRDLHTRDSAYRAKQTVRIRSAISRLRRDLEA